VKEHYINLRGWQVQGIREQRITLLTVPITRLTGILYRGRITEFGRSDTPGYDWRFRDSRARWNEITTARLLDLCPFGQPGDMLVGRETWCELLHTSPATDEPYLCEGDKLIEHATRRPDGGWYYDGKVIAYRATSAVEFCDGDGFCGDMANKDDMPRWRSPVTMPREFARIVVPVVSVRAMRVQKIDNEIAKRCGMVRIEGTVNFTHRPNAGLDYAMCCADNERMAYSVAYNLDHGPGAWEANPWVWVIGIDNK
jgi:hypothetical protein